MTLLEAYNNVKIAVRAYQANADVHDALRESLQLLEQLVQKELQATAKHPSELTPPVLTAVKNNVSDTPGSVS